MQAVPVSVDQFVGQTFSDFSVDRLLGQGSLSAVYLAHKSSSERRALLTVFLLPAWCEEPQHALFMERFSKIASVLVSLDHPHIMPTYDFGEKFGYPYLVTEFLEEVSVASVLKQQIRCTPMQTLALLKQIADALDYAHEHNMVHGTLKPANILLDSQQNVHITGLGLAHILAMSGIGTTQHSLPHLYSIADTMLYSSEYLAPEVVEGQPIDARSDIYALGCIVYELLCGQPPFTGDDPQAVAMQHVQQPIPSLQSVYAQAPAALDLIVQRTLDRDPDRRYKSASKLSSVFGRVLNVLDSASNPASVWHNPASRLDISERPTLPWFEADSSSIVQWSPLFPNTGDAVSMVSGLRSIMPPAVPWNAVRSAMENANQPDTTSVVPLPPQPATEISPVQSPLSPEANQAQLVANGVLPPNIWPTSVPELGRGLAVGTFLPENNGVQLTQQQASSPINRRKILLFATGGVVATGLLALGSLSLAHMLSSTRAQGHSNTTAGIKDVGTSSETKNPGAIAPKNTVTAAPSPSVAPTPTSVETAIPQNTGMTMPTPTVLTTPTSAVAATPTSTATAIPKKKSKNHKS
jgi:serine/threonine protein kinase